MAEIPFEIDGYIIEELELPYPEKEGRIFYFCKEEICEETHKRIREEKYSELERILKKKWCESEKEKHNVGLYRATIEWLEEDFIEWLTEELSKKFERQIEKLCEEYFILIDGLGEKLDEFKQWLKKKIHHTGLGYSFLLLEGNDSYFIVKNDISVEFINREQKSLIKKYIGSMGGEESEKKLEWINKNAKKFREEVLERCRIDKEICKNYIIFKNLEKEIKKEMG